MVWVDIAADRPLPVAMFPALPEPTVHPNARATKNLNQASC
jgi:hypothetical protein